MTSISLSWPVALQSLEDLDQGSRQPDLALEPGKAEQPADLAAVADHLETAPVRGGAPRCAGDRAESRGVRTPSSVVSRRESFSRIEQQESRI